jgi:uncharacterized protein DUF6789
VAATIAGLVAGIAFVLVMDVDLRLTGRNVDDRIALGRPFVADRPERAKSVGFVAHLIASIGFGWLYAWLQRWLPGPPWWRGVLVFNIENLLLYPLTAWEDLHPAIRDRQIDRYFTWPAFFQSIPRHVVYGAVLGALYDRLARRHSEQSDRQHPSC